MCLIMNFGKYLSLGGCGSPEREYLLLVYFTLRGCAGPEREYFVVYLGQHFSLEGCDGTGMNIVI